MGCHINAHVNRNWCVCSYKSYCKVALLSVGLLMCLLLVLGITVEEHDGVKTTNGQHFVMRSATVILATRRSMAVKSFAEKDRGGEDSDQRSPYHAAAASGHKVVDINYMSKRRVPNGADPIHNRRAGKSRRPPSRS